MNSIQAYHALVDRLAIEAEQQPQRYRLRLALLALAGFAVLGGSLLLAVGLAVGTVVLIVVGKAYALLKLAIFPLAFAWLVLKSMWLRIGAPDGYRLKPGEAPDLVAEVERLRKAANAPPLAAIYITDELNAAAASEPRVLGLLGHRHHLVIGLPLLQRLDRTQLAAVLAHEFGHFGGGHSWFAGWIYRVRLSWNRVRDGLADGSWAAKPLIAFFNWYAPYFSACSYVFARSNEYEADRMAARIVGPEAAAQALVSIQLASLRLDRDFWPDVTRGTLAHPEPPRLLYANMRQSLAVAAKDDAGRLEELLQARPDIDDTHPVLAQRLQALGQPAVVPDAGPGGAAESLLGDLREHLVEHFSGQWLEWVAQDWRRRFEAATAQRARLAELDACAATRVLEAAELAERACLEIDLATTPDFDAEPALSAAIEACPDSAELAFRRGMLLLQRADPRGEADLERAIALDRDYEEAALQRLYAWHRQRGGHEAAAPVLERLQAVFRRQADLNRERSVLLPKDSFEPHQLDEAALARLCESVNLVGGIAKLWVVRKRLVVDDRVPHFVLLVQWRTLTHAGEARLRKLAEAAALDGTWLVVTKEALGGAKKSFKAAAGAPVLDSGWFN